MAFSFSLLSGFKSNFLVTSDSLLKAALEGAKTVNCASYANRQSNSEALKAAKSTLCVSVFSVIDNNEFPMGRKFAEVVSNASVLGSWAVQNAVKRIHKKDTGDVQFFISKGFSVWGNGTCSMNGQRTWTIYNLNTYVPSIET